MSNFLKSKVLNFGSLNIDHVYSVQSFVQPGETISSIEYTKFAGGKGANQSIALARAGANITHAGKIGEDGLFIKEQLNDSGVNTTFVEVSAVPTGHAIIQVDKNGENSIILHGGANVALDEAFINSVLDLYSAGDILLTQNETNLVPLILEKAKEKGLFIVFNPAPMTQEVKLYPLEKIDMLIINETEGATLTGLLQPAEIIASLADLYPHIRLVLTLGKDGLIYHDTQLDITMKANEVKVVDTTAAGDTFIGYLIATMISNNNIENALKQAMFAAEVCVQRKGAAGSIPKISELTFNKS